MLRGRGAFCHFFKPLCRLRKVPFNMSSLTDVRHHPCQHTCPGTHQLPFRCHALTAAAHT